MKKINYKLLELVARDDRIMVTKCSNRVFREIKGLDGMVGIQLAINKLPKKEQKLFVAASVY